MSGNHQRLERLRVTNFQSLAEADIELGPFTVIVGPSNSGKSALLRALRAVVRNVNSPSSVKVGKAVFTASVEFDGHRVSIERGKSQSTYRAHLPGDQEEVYTKAGRTVPDDVQRLLALPEPAGPDLVFSSQIDPPFLLAETGSTAAKMLGDLTNVSRLHAAAKESNRRRLEFSRIWKIRADDAADCGVAMREKFSDLPAKAAILKECRVLLGQVQADARKKDTILDLLDQLHVAEAAEADLRARLEELPQPADIEALAERAGALLGTRHAILETLDALAQLVSAEDHLKAVMGEARAEEEQAHGDYHATLVQAGKCPTCGQVVSA